MGEQVGTVGKKTKKVGAAGKKPNSRGKNGGSYLRYINPTLPRNKKVVSSLCYGAASCITSL